jgi:hypothetical protein
MDNQINVYKIAKSYADDIMAEREYWSEDDVYDIAAQHADGSEYVIYYAQAHDFVRELPSDVQNDAEDQVADCGGAEGYDDYAVKIAYFALQAMICAEVSEMLEAEEAEA